MALRPGKEGLPAHMEGRSPGQFGFLHILRWDFCKKMSSSFILFMLPIYLHVGKTSLARHKGLNLTFKTRASWAASNP